jgi:RHS repeat-associated protein
MTETSSGRTYYAWGGQNVLAEYTETGSGTIPEYYRAYNYAGSRLISMVTNGITQYHHPDRLGTRLITGSPNAATGFQSILPFGTAMPAETSGFSSNQVFTSYDRSANTGLDYAINRTYSQGQSRFTQVDPIGMSSVSVGDPQSNNLFAYTQNMPTDYVDPSGLNAQGPGSGQNGIVWTWMHFRDGVLVGMRQWFEAYPGQGDGMGGGGGKPLSTVEALLKGGARFFDVNKIGDKLASTYFGSDAPKGLTVEQYFNQKGVDALTHVGDGITGIYSRGGEKKLTPMLKLHEISHLAQGLRGATGDLDDRLAERLRIENPARRPSTNFVSAYFNSECNPVWLKPRA